MNDALLYKDKPLFGLDIGYKSLKVMQVNMSKNVHVVGYGVANFDPKIITEGVITDPEALAKVIKEMFDRDVVGNITTRRVALSAPAARTYSRTMQLPKLSTKELMEAIQLEAEQYIPIPLSELYIDYDILKKTATELEVLVVAVPKKIIDSYMLLANMLGLEVAAIEPTINACSRLFVKTSPAAIPPTMLIDFGGISTDITIYDKSIIVTGTTPGGGDSFTNAIGKQLGVTHEEAHIIKTKYGLGISKKQNEILEAISPLLDSILKEVRRMMRYYEERTEENTKIAQIITLGGGANMPGIAEYMTEKLRLPVRLCYPWEEIDFGRLQPPNSAERSMYLTVAGLSMIHAREIFA